jgi:N6-adenosine-specific RNA methylase IME4
MKDVWGREEVCTEFWWDNLMERDHLVDPDLDGKIILRQILPKWGVKVRNRLSWLRVETDGGHLKIR